MTIERILPSARLAPYIKEYLLIESDADVCNKPLPDTYLVMTFRYSGLVQLQANVPENLGPTSLSGLRKSVRHFNYLKGTGNLLVIFKECGIQSFRFKPVPAHELYNLHISSENLVMASELDRVLCQLMEATTSRQRVRVVEAFLLDKMVAPVADGLINHAVDIIKAQHGMVKIKALASSLFISQDAFEKRFRTLVGSTPKQFASIVRLRHLITAFPSYTSLTDASYDAGYFDQSHFIRDFRAFTGETPRRFFSAGPYW